MSEAKVLNHIIASHLPSHLGRELAGACETGEPIIIYDPRNVRLMDIEADPKEEGFFQGRRLRPEDVHAVIRALASSDRVAEVKPVALKDFSTLKQIRALFEKAGAGCVVGIRSSYGQDKKMVLAPWLPEGEVIAVRFQNASDKSGFWVGRARPFIVAESMEACV